MVRRLGFERLEARWLSAADLQITEAYLRDYAGFRLNTAPIGEQIEVVAVWTTRDLASNAKYDVRFRVNGYEVIIPAIMQGAGQASFSGLLAKLGWYAFQGTNVVQVHVDPSNAIAEADETNNSLSFQFTAAIPSPPTLFSWPLSERLFSTYGISSYSDVDPSSGVTDHRRG